MHYGFLLALHSTRYRLTHSAQFASPTIASSLDSVKAITPANSMGFGLGLIVNFRFSRFFSLRTTPTISFYNRSVDYLMADGKTVAQEQESTNIEIPLLLKYQSLRRDNVRMYMVAGLKGSIAANAKNKEAGNERLNVNTTDLAVEYGAGFDLFYQFVKFSPEIRFSHGLLNLLTPGENIYTNGIQRLSSHTVSLYLHFE